MLTRRRTARMNLVTQPGLDHALERPRYEILPLSGAEDAVREHAPGDAKLTVTASVSKGMAATVDLSTRLASQGWDVVPHVSARLIADEAELKETLSSLSSAGVREVFVIGGDSPTPVGSFASALDLLNAMEWLGHDFVVGVAGYPESHPRIRDDIAIQAMWDKTTHASYIVSQMCFDADQLRKWLRRVRDRGVTLPVYVGVSGPSKTSHLLRVSGRIGVGESTRVLRHHGSSLLRIAQPGMWRPDSLLRKLAPVFADPEYLLAGLHIYTFNGIETAEQWRSELIEHLQ